MQLGKYYIRGVGVGLVIAWVTGALAYLRAGGSHIDAELIGLELVLSMIFLSLSVFMKDRKR